MGVVTGISLSRMKNEVHVQFNESINSLILKTGIEALEIEPFYALYRKSLDNELEALDFIRKSELTAQISEQDRVRDAIFRGFSDTVKGFRNHFDDEVRYYANILWNVFLHYGNIAQKPLDAETAAINDFLRELQRADCAEAIEQLRMNDWIEKMNAENEKFHKLMMERYNEAAGKTTFRMKSVRLETDNYYRSIMSWIENRVTIGKMNRDNGFIVELNAIISRFKNILAQEFGRKAKTIINKI